MKTTNQIIQDNAIIYQRYKDRFPELTRKQLTQYRFEVAVAFNKLPCNVDYVNGQPYTSVEELTVDARKGIIKISRDFNDSKLLPGKLNLEFRAVHDYLHYTLQAPFTAAGEMEVYKLQAKLHNDFSKKLLYSEVILQACFAEYFGKFIETQKIVLL